MPRRRAANGGFTLVELLVVIGIIAMLIAILLPALSKARQSAKLVHCAANLRSMWQAAELCATERKGWVAPTGLSGRVYFKSTDRGYPGMGDINCQRYHWYSKPDGLLRPVPVTVVLAHYMNLAPSIGTREEIQEVIAKPAYAAVFQCPAGPSDLRPYPTLFDNDLDEVVPEPTDYGFNDGVLGWTARLFVSEHWDFGRITDVRRPAEVVFITDINSEGPNPGWSMAVDEGRTLWDVRDVYVHKTAVYGGHTATNWWAGKPLHEPFDLYRHGGKMNIIYLDGHGETITIPRVHSEQDKGDLGRVNVSIGLRDL